MYKYFEFGPAAVVVSSKNSPQHIYLLEKHFLHAMSKLPRYVDVSHNVVTESTSYTLSGLVHTAN